MNIIDTWVEYPLSNVGKQWAYGMLVCITILTIIGLLITQNWDYFPFVLLGIAACVMIPLSPPTTYVVAEVTDAPFVEVVQKYELFSAREEEGLYVFKVKSNE